MNDFLQEGCGVFAKNATDLLRLASEPATIPAVLRLIHSMPRSFQQLGDQQWQEGVFNQTVKKAVARNGREPRLKELTDYFFRDLLAKDTAALDVLTGVFKGVLSVKFDQEQKANGA